MHTIETSRGNAPQAPRLSADGVASRKLAIVPAYNEQGSVGEVVRAIRREAPDFDIVVIDDGSTDRTAAEAESAGAVVVKHPFNLGIGGAMQSGFQFAMRHGYAVAAQVDGDGQHDPAYQRNQCEALSESEGVDMVCGTRFREGAGYKVPVGRRLGMVVFSAVLSLIMRQRVTDPTSGFRVTNRRGIELFARDYPHDYPEVEAILMTHAHRLRFAEVPVRMSQRLAGRSSIKAGASVYYMVKVTLAVFVGLFRARPAVEPGDDAAVTAQRGI
jgi:glycosyltransferase involved in cell wall biosynthesis